MDDLLRELLDHVSLDEQYLRRLLKDCDSCCHQHHRHLGLGKDCPRARPAEPCLSAGA